MGFWSSAQEQTKQELLSEGWQDVYSPESIAESVSKSLIDLDPNVKGVDESKRSRTSQNAIDTIKAKVTSIAQKISEDDRFKSENIDSLIISEDISKAIQSIVEQENPTIKTFSRFLESEKNTNSVIKSVLKEISPSKKVEQAESEQWSAIGALKGLLGY